jgi:hypothetical protein
MPAPLFCPNFAPTLGFGHNLMRPMHSPKRLTKLSLEVLLWAEVAMDWKSFIASIVGSLAWPSVVVTLLILLREQIGSLAEHLQELSLPVGARASFEKQLETARKSQNRRGRG